MKWAAAALALCLVAGCQSQSGPDDSTVSSEEGGGAPAYGGDAFPCFAGLGDAGAWPMTWSAAASCVTSASFLPPDSYSIDSTPCGGMLEARETVVTVVDEQPQQTVWYLLYDATSEALEAVLVGPGAQSVGFSCAAATSSSVAVYNDCLVHWQGLTASDPCVDAGIGD